MVKMLKATLTAVALLALAIACGNNGDSQFAQSDIATPVTNPIEPDSATPAAKPAVTESATPGTAPVETDSATPVTTIAEADSPTPTPKVIWVVPWPEKWPVPPLPVMWLEHESGPTRGSPHAYCWQFEDPSDRVCEEYTIWSGVREYPEVVPGSHIPIRIDADARPSKVFAQVFTRPGTIMVGGLWRLSTVAPGLDLADVGPGVYNVRIIGHWEDNRVSHEFGLSVPGSVKLMSECSQTVRDADPILALESLDDRRRTAPDSSNSGGCSFNKPIAHVTLTLQNNDFGPYTETFHIDPPSVSVSFPLREGRTSERSGDPLPPGQYSRQMVVAAEDGEELEIRWASPDLVILADP